MIYFKNDYSEGAHPAILEALANNNMTQEEGYGLDDYTLQATEKLKELMENQNVDIHLLTGGTMTNLLTISSSLRPHEACIAVDTGHIAVHETGAIEQTGHKVITTQAIDGKITVDAITSVLRNHPDEHMVKPKMVYISNPTELGTVYSLDELELISKYCKESNLLLYVDGARLGSALTLKSNQTTLSDLCRLTDAFFIGATKNGALLGEALIIVNEGLKEDFRYLIKQKGGLLAKGRVLGIQFYTLFKDNLYFDLANHANEMAEILRHGLETKSYDFFIQSPTNQIFPILNNDLIKRLEEEFAFYVWAPIDENRSAIRLVTSWATTKDAVTAFINALD